MARLPQRARLRGAPQFDLAFRQGKRLQEGPLSAVVRLRQDGEARLGLAISRKAVPLAVTRNRIKRQARESFRQHRRELAAVDVVIFARPPAKDAPRTVVHSALDRLWTRIIGLCSRDS